MKCQDTESTYPNFSILIQIGTILGNQSLAQRLVTNLADGVEFADNDAFLKWFLNAIAHATPNTTGLTELQLKKIKAALEIGKQLYCRSPSTAPIVDDPAVAAGILQPLIGYSTVENFAVILLNVKHRVIATKIISRGVETETYAHPNQIFRVAVLGGACRIIVGHNHPSGSADPSPEDIELTKDLLRAAATMCIPLLDHIVVSHGQHTSIRQTTALWTEIPQKE